MTSSFSETRAVFVFQCSSNTYLDCLQQQLFGSNDPWPLKVKAGDFCLLHHYEFDTHFALWRATTDGGRKLVAKAWGGKFPFQVRVALTTPALVELPKGSLGSAERVLEGERAVAVLELVRSLAPIADR
ncbi:MAG: hypothetical protein IPN34_16665 [Planctomycetes bacterium]|nr:hypothetical protein [Planctomycetota bacterium]